jgi:hypothetical protein
MQANIDRTFVSLSHIFCDKEFPCAITLSGFFEFGMTSLKRMSVFICSVSGFALSADCFFGKRFRQVFVGHHFCWKFFTSEFLHERRVLGRFFGKKCFGGKVEARDVKVACDLHF